MIPLRDARQARRAHPVARAAPAVLLGAIGVGIGQSALTEGSPVIMPVVAVTLAACAVVVGVRRPGLCLMAMALALGAAGSAWGDARQEQTRPASVTAGSISGKVRVDAPARPGRAGAGDRVTVRVLGVDDGTARVPEGARLIVDLPRAAPTPRVGSAMRLRGALRTFTDEDAPSWWRRYLEREGIAGAVRADSATPVADPGAGPRERWRGWAQTRVSARLPGERGAVVRGLALGGGAGLSERTATEFRDSGIWHLLAVSGQNVTAVALAVMAVLGAAPRRPAIVVAASCVVAYVLACDGGPSVGRAAVVGLLVLGSQFTGRARSHWHALLLALVGLLAYQPRSLFDPGLHLSFAAVGGLFLLSPGIDALARGWVPRPLAVLLGASLGAGIATAPVLALHFERLSVVGIAVNLVAVPLAAPVVVLALVGLVADALADGAGRPFTAGAAAGGQALMWLARAGSAVPHGAIDVPAWSAAPLGACAAGIFIALRRGHGALLARVGAGITVLAVGSMLLAGPAAWPTDAEVAVLDVGQGQALLLRDARGGAVLVDVGPPGTPAPAVDRLRRLGVQRIDLLVLTHGARDQAGGLADILERWRPAGAIHGLFGGSSGEADGLAGLALLAEDSVPAREVAAGDGLKVGDWRLDVLAPPAGVGGGTAANDRSLVIVARAPGLTVLIPSDAEGPVLLRRPLPPADVLVVSHHGSDDPRLGEVLRQVRPAQAVISAGADNRHGHPAATTLAALGRAGIRVRRTDREGDVRITAATLRRP